MSAALHRKLPVVAVLVVATLVEGCGDAVQPIKVKFSGDPRYDNQLTCAGCMTAFPPTVRLVDQNGKGQPGIEVLFTTTAGDGFLNGQDAYVATTDDDGVAIAGDWVLGNGDGPKQVSVSLNGTSVELTTVNAVAGGCAENVLPFGGSKTSTLNVHSFYDGYGTFMDCYAITVPPGPTQTFSLTAVESAGLTYGYGMTGWFLGTGLPSHFAVPPGQWGVYWYLGKQDTTQTTSYTLSVNTNPNLSGVCFVGSDRNIVVSHILDTNCTYSSTAPGEFTTARSYRAYRMYDCNAGGVTFRLSSSAYAPRIEVYKTYGGGFIAAANGTTSVPAVLNVNPCDDVFVYATHTVPTAGTAAKSGNYTFTIDP